VVQLQTTNATVYYATDLCFGAGCPPEPGTEPPPAPAAAAEPPPASTADPAAAPAAAAPQASATTAAPKAIGTTAEGAATSGRTQALGAGAQTAALTVDADDIPDRVRVLAAEAAGIAGGVLIVLIVTRARRRMALEGAGMPRTPGGTR
jgi:biopolymer transport protein ExbB